MHKCVQLNSVYVMVMCVGSNVLDGCTQVFAIHTYVRSVCTYVCILKSTVQYTYVFKDLTRTGNK